MPQDFPIKPLADVIWITNPHNPTGQLWTRNSLERLIKNYKLVICDEAFLTLVPRGEEESLIKLTSKYSNLIVIRSLTKIFGIAGLRLGYAVSQAERLEKWKKIRDPWPLNSLAIDTGRLLMEDKDLHLTWIQKIHKWIKQEGASLNTNLKEFQSLKVHPTSSNFQLIQSDVSLVHLNQKLNQQGIILRDCRSFQNLGANWLRISLQTKPNNKRMIKSIKMILK